MDKGAVKKMLDQNDLQAIAQLMDQKMQTITQTMDEKLQTITQTMDEKLQTITQTMDEKLKAAKDEIMLDFNTVIENKVSKEIRLIAEQHGDIVARLPDVEEQDELKSRVRILERVVVDLRAEIEGLKKAE